MHKDRRVVLEGGSIDVNGLGTLLTTEECLLSKTQERNPGFTREDYAEIFKSYFGVTNVLWLKNGITGDDTHGHVDDLARFVDPTTVVIVIENNQNDANYAPLQENLTLLKQMKDQDGRALRVETLPMPAPVYFDGQQNRHRPYFQRCERPRCSQHPRQTLPHPRSSWHRLPRLGPGPRDSSLHDATAAHLIDFCPSKPGCERKSFWRLNVRHNVRHII
jgi:hypothetical protein